MFSRVSVWGLRSKNQYSSSISTVASSEVLHFSTSFFALFFYPIHNIGFVHVKDFSHASPADSSVVYFYRQFSGFFRVLMLFRVYWIIYAALLTFTALAPRCVVPCLDLLLYFSAFRTSLPAFFRYFSHASYYIIKSTFWTLPVG